MCAGGALACNIVPVVAHPEPEVRLHAPLDGAAVQRLRVGDSRRRVTFELGEPHHVALNGGGGETFRYWSLSPALEIQGESSSATSEGGLSRFGTWLDRFLFVPTRQPLRPPRVVLPAGSQELVIVFSREGDILASRVHDLKGPLGQ